MNSKKKIIITLSALAMIVLASVITVVAVLAAQRVTLKNSITVEYKVKDVVCDTSVRYAIVTNGTYDWKTAKNANFAYNAESTETTEQELAFGNVSIDKTQCVVIEFTFNNNGSRAFRGTLNETSSEKTNIKIYYASALNQILTSTTETASAINVEAGDEKSGVYYARIDIDQKQFDAKVITNFVWTLDAVQVA